MFMIGVDPHKGSLRDRPRLTAGSSDKSLPDPATTLRAPPLRPNRPALTPGFASSLETRA
jgi:hypothetical protein